MAHPPGTVGFSPTLVVLPEKPPPLPPANSIDSLTPQQREAQRLAKKIEIHRHYWKNIFLKELLGSLAIIGVTIGLAILSAGFPVLMGWIITCGLIVLSIHYAYRKLSFTNTIGATISVIVALMLGAMSAWAYTGHLAPMLIFGAATVVTNTILYSVDVPTLLERSWKWLKSFFTPHSSVSVSTVSITRRSHQEETPERRMAKNLVLGGKRIFHILLAGLTTYVLVNKQYFSWLGDVGAVQTKLGHLTIWGVSLTGAAAASYVIWPLVIIAAIATFAFMYRGLQAFGGMLVKLSENIKKVYKARSGYRLETFMICFFNSDIIKDSPQTVFKKVLVVILLRLLFVLAIAALSQVPLMVGFGSYLPKFAGLFHIIIACAIASRIAIVFQKCTALGDKLHEKVQKSRGYTVLGRKMLTALQVSLTWASIKAAFNGTTIKSKFKLMVLYFRKRLKDNLELGKGGVLLWKKKFDKDWTSLWNQYCEEGFRRTWGSSSSSAERYSIIGSETWEARFDRCFKANYGPLTRCYYRFSTFCAIMRDALMWPLVAANAIANGKLTDEGQGVLVKYTGMPPALAQEAGAASNGAASAILCGHAADTLQRQRFQTGTPREERLWRTQTAACLGEYVAVTSKLEHSTPISTAGSAARTPRMGEGWFFGGFQGPPPMASPSRASQRVPSRLFGSPSPRKASSHTGVNSTRTSPNGATAAMASGLPLPPHLQRVPGRRLLIP